MSKKSTEGDEFSVRMRKLQQENRLAVGELFGPTAVKNLYETVEKPPADWVVSGDMPTHEFHAHRIRDGRAQWSQVRVMPSSSGCAVLVATLDFDRWRHSFCTPLVGVRAAAWAESLRRGDPLVLRLGDGQQDGDGLVVAGPVSPEIRAKLELLVLPLEGSPRERATEFWSMAVQMASIGDGTTGAGRGSASLVIPDELAVHFGQGAWGKSQKN